MVRGAGVRAMRRLRLRGGLGELGGEEYRC